MDLLIFGIVALVCFFFLHFPLLSTSTGRHKRPLANHSQFSQLYLGGLIIALFSTLFSFFFLLVKLYGHPSCCFLNCCFSYPILQKILWSVTMNDNNFTRRISVPVLFMLVDIETQNSRFRTRHPISLRIGSSFILLALTCKSLHTSMIQHKH